MTYNIAFIRDNKAFLPYICLLIIDICASTEVIDDTRIAYARRPTEHFATKLKRQNFTIIRKIHGKYRIVEHLLDIEDTASS